MGSKAAAARNLLELSAHDVLDSLFSSRAPKCITPLPNLRLRPVHPLLFFNASPLGLLRSDFLIYRAARNLMHALPQYAWDDELAQLQHHQKDSNGISSKSSSSHQRYAQSTGDDSGFSSSNFSSENELLSKAEAERKRKLRFIYLDSLDSGPSPSSAPEYEAEQQILNVAKSMLQQVHSVVSASKNDTEAVRSLINRNLLEPRAAVQLTLVAQKLRDMMSSKTLPSSASSPLVQLEQDFPCINAFQSINMDSSDSIAEASISSITVIKNKSVIVDVTMSCVLTQRVFASTKPDPVWSSLTQARLCAPFRSLLSSSSSSSSSPVSSDDSNPDFENESILVSTPTLIKLSLFRELPAQPSTLKIGDINSWKVAGYTGFMYEPSFLLRYFASYSARSLALKGGLMIAGLSLLLDLTWRAYKWADETQERRIT